MARRKLKTVALPLLTLSLASASYIAAQTTATTPTPTAVVKPASRPVAPQVVTVIHRLNGIKVLRMLLRSGAVGAVNTMDEAFSMTSEVHTNIIAGLVLEDGATIAVWLPEAEVEVDAWDPVAPSTGPFSPRANAALRAATPGSVELTADLSETPELLIIGRDGRRHPAQYIGLDGITGLSLLRISDKNLPVVARMGETPIAVRQRVRLFSPEPVAEGRASTSNTVSVRLGETTGMIAGLKRGLRGEISRVKMSAPKFSKANVGGVAINDAGQTIGIVAGIEGNEAVILPPEVIRNAARRVLARKGSVPRPWLGVSGEALALTPLEGIVERGWDLSQARSLLKNQNGILLTSITPGSPAELAALRAGDVIVRVNNNEVKSADDFSLFLEAAGESPLLFTFVRPDHPQPESVAVTLSEALEPFRLKEPGFGPRAMAINPLIKQGIETMPLLPAAAAHLNSSGGLLVMFVQPQTPAFKAGLRLTDVIEAINGQPVLKVSPQLFQELTAGNYSLSVIRDRQKLVLTVDITTP